MSNGNEGVVRGAQPRRPVINDGEQQQHQHQYNDNAMNGPRGLAERFGARVARTPAGESIKKYLQLFQQVNTDNGEIMGIHALDAGVHNLALGVLVFSASYEDDSGRKTVVAHMRIVEAAGSIPATRLVEVEGTNRSVELAFVAGDAIDADTAWDKKVLPELIRQYGTGVTFISAGWSVLHKELKPEEANIGFFHAIYQVAAEAITRTAYNKLGSGEVLNVDAMRPGTRENPNPDFVPGTRYQLRIDHNPPPCYTPDDLPVRNDVELVTTENVPDSQNRGQAQATEICRVAGFTYFEATDAPQQMFGEQVSYARFRPIFCVTQVQSNIQQSLEAYLFALHTAYAMADPSNWMYGFHQRRGANGALRDIGAMGYDVPRLLGEDVVEGAKIDTRSATFGMDKVVWLLNTATHVRRFGFQLDVGERDDFAWQTLVFLGAAEGDQDATRAIIQAANNLTNGRFGQIWAGIEIVEGLGNQLETGYYHDSNNERRSLDDWTYLEMLNKLGDQDVRDLPLATDFDRTFSDVNRPIADRRYERQNIYYKVCGDSYRVTGKKFRLNILPDFMAALYSAIECDGFQVGITNINNDFHVTGRRSVEDVERYGIDVSRRGGALFSRGGMGLGSRPGSGRAMGGAARW